MLPSTTQQGGGGGKVKILNSPTVIPNPKPTHYKTISCKLVRKPAMSSNVEGGEGRGGEWGAERGVGCSTHVFHRCIPLVVSPSRFPRFLCFLSRVWSPPMVTYFALLCSVLHVFFSCLYICPCHSLTFDPKTRIENY